ncbi:ribonucleotide-diphosphate reductase alpha subunit [Bacillus phage SP-15]|uniref:Ribonucleoside-diphosphate reductase n=1 Tax=Bacillus phage SP-15 TaxID=1792032 RepID=A0A127AW21_9CAUD|nr:ribonucleotide reductase large subunit [Bacillus phage SP-15]AMM44828.1 ribonucleotide-diphosphate reductase alpha subunit [Bacillus phage SP-15]
MNTLITKENGVKSLPFDEPRLLNFIKQVTEDYPHLDIDSFTEKVLATITSRETYPADQITNLMVLTALDHLDQDAPDWTFVASRIYLQSLYKQASKNRGYDIEKVGNYGPFYSLLRDLINKGIYNKRLLKDYTRAEINELGSLINQERDKLFTYIGLRTLTDRYTAKSHDHRVYELPQERFMIIAMLLNINEPADKRMDFIKNAYKQHSLLRQTSATPTMSNAGKSYGQLSSCFIDTVDDSLDGIFGSNHDVARLSKDGGGIGVYLGKIRNLGSDIKNFEGVASGVLPWMKQLNNTAVSVDQLGQRQGSIAVYLDVWHKDIFAFLDAKLNNGDERLRTHDLYTGVCIPDIFMEIAEERGEWYLFDPHKVRKHMGYSLEDFYDEKLGEGSFRTKYFECVEAAKSGVLPKSMYEVVSAIDIFKRIMKSQLETGAPYMFYRDTVNRANPNKHKGMIYCSNLCTEIMQNMKPTIIETEEIVTREDGQKRIVTTKIPGDFVVCNLASLNLGRVERENSLEETITSAVRGLDNVIDLNTISVLQAQVTNQNYRAIGLGTFGWHHLLAQEGIMWETERAVERCDELYEDVAYYAIKASHELALEKGAYPYFPGSDWNTGEYFVLRGYVDRNDKGEILPIEGQERWYELALAVMKDGIRNGYIMAVAPNSSTAVIAGSTASIDPVFKKFYSEEKKNYKIPVTAPELSARTTWHYKSAYNIDQHWSIKQNAARQRHVDQSISFNLYVNRQIKAKDLLDLHFDAWRSGLKTTYYTRSTAVEIEECESCAS